jgi:membrane associated rhomboid family serine protease
VGNGVIFLILINYVVFFLDKYTSLALVSNMPLVAWKWHWWQLITYAFCHADFNHLAGNMFMLLTFGRTVEEEEGAFGLIVTYVICSIGVLPLAY